MIYLKDYLIIFTLFISLNKVYVELKIQNIDITYNNIQVPVSENDKYYWILNEDHSYDVKNVHIKLYYESLCPYCINFYKQEFKSAVVMLSDYVEFETYPYGNADTFNVNGNIMFECQHGPPECYGNKLHACAIKKLQNVTKAVIFNSCMMGGEDRGSNDAAADRCESLLGLEANSIKNCAKDEEGTQLLEYYGEESKKANSTYVPYILINGKEYKGDNFIKDLCSEFTIEPPPCMDLLLKQIKTFIFIF